MTPHTNGFRPSEPESEPLDILAEAEALKNLLAQAITHSSRLLAALRTFRRQQKAVQSAMNTLKAIAP